MNEKFIIASEDRKIVSVHEMPKELRFIMSQVEKAVRNKGKRYIVSSRRLRPEYDTILMNAGYKIRRGCIVTQISW